MMVSGDESATPGGADRNDQPDLQRETIEDLEPQEDESADIRGNRAGTAQQPHCT